ncbi:MAG: PEP-CTERM sorting domain-containing protein [Methylococcaceae bacterium]|nr:PEP-CTERM sorting domain-containing protein [Methylococcaceae bacterium]MDP3904189.1 PEP-CTERM sorting domain-containing protein [Methylococcaceae bacterium]
MKKNLAVITTLSLALLCSAQAFATPVYIAIDDFNSDDQFVSDTTVGDGLQSNTNAKRTLTNELLSGSGPIQSVAQVSFGILDISNGSGEDSEVSVAWNLDAGLLPVTAFPMSFLFEIVQSDGNQTSLDFFFNNDPLSSFSIAPNTNNQIVAFGLTPAQLAQINAGAGSLLLKINGDTGWDLSVDAIGFSYDDGITTSIPEPVTLALISLGLAGLGFHKKKQA